MDELSGRVAVVTGAASGIGLALAERFQIEGMRVVLADVETGPLDAVARRLAGRGEVLAVPTDVADAGSVLALRAAALARFGRVHVVCNNAGVIGSAPMADLALTTWQWVLGVNLWGVIHGVSTFLPDLLAQGEGHVVNTASVAGLLSFAGSGPYNVSKHAVVALSETLHHELALSGARVGVTVLCPGFVNTRIVDADRNRPANLTAPMGTEDDVALTEGLRAVARDAMGRQTNPSEVAGLVVDAILQRRFYCYTDDAFSGAVAARHRHIEEGTNPDTVGSIGEHLMR